MRTALTAFFALLIAGCGVTTNVQHKIAERTGELTYVHDSEPARTRSAVAIAVRSFTVDDVLPPATTVKEVDSSTLPLLVYNKWTEDMRAQLGYDRLKNDYKAFMRERFLAELRRSGVHEVREGTAELSIAVRVRKLEMSAPIRHEGTFIFLLFIIGGGHYYAAGPVSVVVQADVEITRGGTTVLAGSFVGKHATTILAGNNVQLQDYTIAMIEGVSMAVKDLNERIVSATNRI